MQKRPARCRVASGVSIVGFWFRLYSAVVVLVAVMGYCNLARTVVIWSDMIARAWLLFCVLWGAVVVGLAKWVESMNGEGMTPRDSLVVVIAALAPCLIGQALKLAVRFVVR
jgi:hypothetical protein